MNVGKGEIVSTVLFGDGILEERSKEHILIYTIEKKSIQHEHAFKQMNNQIREYELKQLKKKETTNHVSLVFQKPNKKMSILLPIKMKNLKKKQWHDIRDTIAQKIVEICFEQYKEGFFVLPIPENFLLSQTNEVYIIYKATEHQPITGFNFHQLFDHTKRLIIYLYSEIDFETLVDKGMFQTEDSFLLELSNTQTFEELYLLLVKNDLNGQTKTEKSQELQSISNCELEEIATVSIEPLTVNKQIKNSQNIAVIILVSALLMTIILVTDSRNIQYSLEKENIDHQITIKKQELKVKELIKKLEKIEEKNKKLEEELTSNIELIKELLAKNSDSQKKEKRGGS